MLEKGTLEFMRKYISSVRWIFAKTYAETAPHEYTLRKEKPDLDGDFVRFAQLIRSEGYDDQFWNQTHRYLDIDGHQYWTMGDAIENTILINRAIKAQKT
jgi:hypothetical protein